MQLLVLHGTKKVSRYPAFKNGTIPCFASNNTSYECILIIIDKIPISSIWIIYYSNIFPVVLCFCRSIGSVVVLRYFSQVSY